VRLPYALELAIPIIVFFLMWLVGLRVTLDDFRRVLDRLRLAAATLLSQALVLPLLALATGWLVGAPLPVRIALLLIASSPAGIFSNAYTLLSRGNLALSLTFTASGTLLSVITLPLVADAGLTLLTGQRATTLHVPILRAVGELGVTVLLPVALGMALKSPMARVPALERGLQTAGALATAALIAAVLYVQWESVRRGLPTLGAAVTIFSLAAALAGRGVAAAMRTDRADRMAIVFEFPSRNLGLAVLVAINSLGLPEAAGFASAFALVQIPLLLLMSLALRRASPAPSLASST